MLPMFESLLSETFLNNTLLDYLTALIIVLVGLILLKVLKTFLAARLKRIAGDRSKNIFEVLLPRVLKNVMPLLSFGIVYAGVTYLTINPSVQRAIDVLGIAILTFFGIRFLVSLVDYLLEKFWLQKDENEQKENTVRAITPVIRFVVWGLGLVFLLDNLGFKISTVIAGLGIGGIAVALAAQAVLGDLFSYFSILFDRPFKIGDFLIVGDHLGAVEHIGIKTTRLRSLSGEQLIFSNTDLTSSRVRNFKRMERRRVAFKIGVIYQTSQEKLEEIPGMIKAIIQGIEMAEFDRAHFAAFGGFSLNFEIVYYVLSSDYNIYMDIQQRINLEIGKAFKQHNIEFAYPTQTLLFQNATAKSNGYQLETEKTVE